VCPVWEGGIRLTSSGRRGEGDDEEEDIDGAEEASSNETEDGNSWPVLRREEVEVDDAKGDGCVDDRQGV